MSSMLESTFIELKTDKGCSLIRMSEIAAIRQMNSSYDQCDIYLKYGTCFAVFERYDVIINKIKKATNGYGLSFKENF